MLALSAKRREVSGESRTGRAASYTKNRVFGEFWHLVRNFVYMDDSFELIGGGEDSGCSFGLFK